MDLIRKIVFVLCMIIFVGSAATVLDYIIDGAKEQKDLTALLKLKAQNEDLIRDKGIVMGKYADLYLRNKDIIGWLTIEDTKIDYPVMQTKSNPQYYLSNSFEKKHAVSGVPFMDAASDIFIPTSNFLIYGHNMKNGTMFHDLLKYENKDFYRKHKTFKFDTIYKGGQGTYEVVAAGRSKIYSADSKSFKYYKYGGCTSKEDFDTYVKGVKSSSEYDTGVEPKYGEQLVTLSTCAYHTKNGRFFLVGRRIDKSIKGQ